MTTPVALQLSIAHFQVPQVPQGQIPGTHHLPSGTPGTPGFQEQSHRLIQIPISSPQVPQVPQVPQRKPIAQYKSLSPISLPQVPQVPLINPIWKIQIPMQSHRLIQIPISPPQVPQVPQRKPIAQYKSLSPNSLPEVPQINPI